MSHKSILPVLVDTSAAGMVNIQILLYKMNVKLRIFKQAGILLPRLLPVVFVIKLAYGKQIFYGFL